MLSLSNLHMTKSARQALIDNAMAERVQCRAWLLMHMAHGKPKAFTKEEYRQMAIAELGNVSKAAFDTAWVLAIEDTGRHDWYQSKPRRKGTLQ